ncbi:MAG: RPA family protein [Halobacteriales archaeon]
MSTDEQSGAGRREVAYRVFAAEYDDADFQYTENEVDERAPNYVVTPTGARVNRLFVVGVLTEVERVNEEMLRGRIVDPTGAFVVYAGQYQPDALTALERLDPPAFVAVTGKARTFQPEDTETIYTSVRPESINEVDADTRDRWTVGTARHTLGRIAAVADGIEREARGEELTTSLEADGVDHGLAAGIPLAVDHYDTTPAYLEAIRVMAIEAVEVVAGERGKVTPLGLAPDEGGATDVDLGIDESFTAAGDSSTKAGSSLDATDGSSATESAGEAETSTSSRSTSESTAASSSSGEDLTEIASRADEPDAGIDEPDAGIDEMYEFAEGEREEIESEFGTEFSTGVEVDEPGDSDLDVPNPEDDEPREETESLGTESDTKEDSETSEEPATDVDLEDAVVEAMRDLDSGDGADRAAVIEIVSDEHGADSEEVEDAIQDALMSGTCYEPGDGLLKAI